MLDKFGYAAENPGEYLIYNQAASCDTIASFDTMESRVSFGGGVSCR